MSTKFEPVRTFREGEKIFPVTDDFMRTGGIAVTGDIHKKHTFLVDRYGNQLETAPGFHRQSTYTKEQRFHIGQAYLCLDAFLDGSVREGYDASLAVPLSERIVENFSRQDGVKQFGSAQDIGVLNAVKDFCTVYDEHVPALRASLTPSLGVKGISAAVGSTFESLDQAQEGSLTYGVLDSSQKMNNKRFIGLHTKEGSNAVIHQIGCLGAAVAHTIIYHAKKAALDLHSKGLANDYRFGNEIGESSLRKDLVSFVGGYFAQRMQEIKTV